MGEPSIKACDRHSATRVTAEVYKAGVARIEKLMRRRTLASRLLAQVSWGAKPMKELSESLAVFDVALDIAHARRWDRSDPAIRVVVVGDGHSPRTGALVAMSTGWQVTSVDPVLGHHGDHPVIERLRCLRGNIEAFPDLQADIVLAPHSHAPVDATRHVARGGGHVITMPCCVVWPVMPWTLKQISMVCMAPDRTIYIERIMDNDAA